MSANIATNNATLLFNFQISFDKKALREQALSASTHFENMRHELMFPLMLIPLKAKWRADLMAQCERMSALSGHRLAPHHMNALFNGVESYAQITQTMHPLVSVELLLQLGEALGESIERSAALDAWIEWVNADACMRLAPAYRAVLAIYYLHVIRPFKQHQLCINMALLTFLLRCAGFDAAAEGVAYHFCSNDKRLANAFVATQQSVHQQYFQTEWIKYYLTSVQEFMNDTQKIMQHRHQQALYDQIIHGDVLNARQVAIMDQLMSNKKIRDKKTLFGSSFYIAMYHKQSRRTKERDFKILCELQLILMKDTQAFSIVIDALY